MLKTVQFILLQSGGQESNGFHGAEINVYAGLCFYEEFRGQPVSFSFLAFAFFASWVCCCLILFFKPTEFNAYGKERERLPFF